MIAVVARGKCLLASIDYQAQQSQLAFNGLVQFKLIQTNRKRWPLWA